MKRIVRIACVGFTLLGCNKSDETKPASGKTPEAKVAQEAVKVDAHTVYESKCVPCHGSKGVGDGPAASALTPKPRNYTDKEWQKSVTDEQLRKTIVYGGAAVGKSAVMPGSPELDAQPETVEGLVKIIRDFGK